jgi:hypothetical protein
MTHFNRLFWEAIWDAVFHRLTILIMVVFCVSTSIESPIGFLSFSEVNLIGIVAPIAGTIVALALPAAQLSMDLITQAGESGVKFLIQPIDQNRRRQYINQMVEKYRTNLLPAWRAVVYALLSFLLSIVGSLGPFKGSLGSRIVATSSLSLLVASAIWFYPTVRFAFRLEFLKVLVSIADTLDPDAENTPENLGDGPATGAGAPPNPYEAPGCQGVDVP